MGSGPGGSILASLLVRQGISTVLLEGGRSRVSSASESADVAGSLTRVDPVDYPVSATRFEGDGGTSNLWGGESPRLQPLDFIDDNPALPEGVRWPLTYGDLEPYYFAAEQELAIAGGPSTRFSPPRHAAFPFALERSNASSCLEDLLRRHGWESESVPRSLFGRVAISHLLPLRTNTLCQFVRARVTAIRTDRAGEVTGISAQLVDGGDLTVSARKYVLAAGGIETPRLLLLSTSRRYPRGIGNEHDQVGRNFMEHLATHLASATLPRRVWSCAKNEYGGSIGWQFYHDFKAARRGGAIFEFGVEPARRTLEVSAVLEMKPVATNRVLLDSRRRDSNGQPLARVQLSISADERRTWEHAQLASRKVLRSLGANSIMMGDDRFTWCHHHIGTCRMGRDPTTSVVDENLRVHGTSNLYVTGSAAFVTAGVGGPTLLLTALSLRLADHLTLALHRGRSPGVSRDR